MAIVMADDDLDESQLMADAWSDAGCSSSIVFVPGGAELLDYLARRGKYADAAPANVVLLDLNMPGVDGWEVLEKMAEVSHLSRVPVVVLTVSSSIDDIARAYRLGASGFLTKPSRYGDIVRLAKIVDDYWFGIASLPNPA